MARAAMCSLARAAAPQKGPRGNACNAHGHTYLKYPSGF